MLRNLTTGIVAAIAATGSVKAQEIVEIQSNDGSMVIKGELQESEPDVYRIKSAIGMISMPRELSICIGAACPSLVADLKEFTITGASVAGGDLLARLVSGFAGQNQAEVFVNFIAETRAMQMSMTDVNDEEFATVSIDQQNSSAAFAKLLNDESQIVLVTRRPNDEERAAFAAAGRSADISAANEQVLALDGLALVVSDDNPLRSLSLDEAAAVFSGQVSNWSAFGGPDAPIQIVSSGIDAATTTFFREEVLAPRNLDLSSNMTTAASEADVAEIVRNDPRAIGVTSISAAGSLKALPIQLTCGLVAPPSSFAMKAEEYPLARRLFLYSKTSGIPDRAAELIDYALSDAGQDRIAEAGFVDRSVDQRDMNAFGMRLAAALIASDATGGVGQLRNMATELIDSVQLSSTLRFRTGSAELDSKALTDIDRLISLFTSGDIGQREVVLVGFTDSVGRLDLNNVLSQRRAQQVKANIVAASNGSLNPNLIRVVGFGPTAPIGCNDTEAGRNVNRRVEVWLKDAS